MVLVILYVIVFGVCCLRFLDSSSRERGCGEGKVISGVRGMDLR